mgnify:FL=1
MSKEVKNFKLKDLKIGIPDSGKWNDKYEGLEEVDYDYAPLKKSLQDEGYKPDKYNYITATDEGKIMYGSRRVWLMQQDMSMDQEDEIAVEIMTKKEREADITKRLNADIPPERRTLKKDGKMITATVRPAALNVGPKKALRARHKASGKNIPGYPYDFEFECKATGKIIKVDAGKS